MSGSKAAVPLIAQPSMGYNSVPLTPHPSMSDTLMKTTSLELLVELEGCLTSQMVSSFPSRHAGFHSPQEEGEKLMDPVSFRDFLILVCCLVPVSNKI